MGHWPPSTGPRGRTYAAATVSKLHQHGLSSSTLAPPLPTPLQSGEGCPSGICRRKHCVPCDWRLTACDGACRPSHYFTSQENCGWVRMVPGQGGPDVRLVAGAVACQCTTSTGADSRHASPRGCLSPCRRHTLDSRSTLPLPPPPAQCGNRCRPGSVCQRNRWGHRECRACHRGTTSCAGECRPAWWFQSNNGHCGSVRSLSSQCCAPTWSQ